MAIEMSYVEQDLTSSKTSRLRLMTLLSLYDMLPHSISRPPTGQEPMDLDDAIDPETVKRVLALVRAGDSSAASNDSYPYASDLQSQVCCSYFEVYRYPNGLNNRRRHNPERAQQ